MAVFDLFHTGIVSNYQAFHRYLINKSANQFMSMNLRNALSAFPKTLTTILSAAFLFISSVGHTQPAENRILVLGDATEEVPANQVTLNIILSYNDERDSKVAYQEHQQAQQQLTTLLNQLKVPSQDIRFQQLLSRKGRDYQRGQPSDRFTTYQRVLVKFNDLSQYSQAQQTLTANGFTDLTVSFSVGNQRDIELRLLEKAVARAQEKATLLAKATSRSIKRVVRVSDVSENEGFYAYRDPNRNNQSQNVINYDGDAVRQLATIPQLFRFAVAVKVEFELN